jgi:hypothetical protein
MTGEHPSQHGKNKSELSDFVQGEPHRLQSIHYISELKVTQQD